MPSESEVLFIAGWVGVHGLLLGAMIVRRVLSDAGLR